jgi:hypothetical protein
MTDTRAICQPCREGRHNECVEREPRFVERRGPLFDYRVELESPSCVCQEGACAERHEEHETP